MNPEPLKRLFEQAGIGVDGPTSTDSLLTPNVWFAEKFPAVAEKFGEAVQIASARSGELVVRELSDDFFAAVLGPLGIPESPTVYMAAENRYYRYTSKDGIYVELSKQELAAVLSNLLRECARACSVGVDTNNLQFKLTATTRLNGALDRTKGLLAVPADYFDKEVEHIIVGNGVIRLADRALLPFGPEFKRRNKIGINYDAAAPCPLFLKRLLGSALCPEDIDLFRRWCGLALAGVNLAQAILILEGPSGAGKGTVVRVINGVLGPNNLTTIRTSVLGERFEIGAMLGRTLLYGPDVNTEFLNNRSAAILKSLTGGDPMTVELKGSNHHPQITARFNVLLTCNSRLKVRLDGDSDAWRRRLHVIRFGAYSGGPEITTLSEQILKEEGSGVLNFMLDGLDQLRADGFSLRRTPRQQAAVEDMVLESSSISCFVPDCFFLCPDGKVTLPDAYDRYVRYSLDRGWAPLVRPAFTEGVTPALAGHFGVTLRHDVADHEGNAQRGWKGVALK